MKRQHSLKLEPEEMKEVVFAPIFSQLLVISHINLLHSVVMSKDW